MAATRALWLLGLAAACGSPGHSATDASVGTEGGYVPPPCMAPGAVCPTTCGNGVVDTCWVPAMPGNHCTFYPMQEDCDGTTTKTCSDLGFYGGTLACTSCRLDAAGCDACAPSSQCASVAPLTVGTVVASGPRVAVASFTDVAIFDGLTAVARTPIADVRHITGVASGWIVVAGNPATLYALDVNGQLGAPHVLWDDAALGKMAYAGGRVLFAVAGPAQSGDTHLYVTITDTTGTIVVPETDLGLIDINGVLAAASDGTAFFVACGGKLFRIATDGTYSLADSGGSGDIEYVVWGGTSGWYGTRYGGQRFDATGALLGAPVALNLGGTVQDFTGAGDDLLALRTSPGVDVVRVDPTGAITAAVHAGAGTPSYAGLARLASAVFVAWTLPLHLQAALVTP